MKKYLLSALFAPLGLYAHAESDPIELQDDKAQKIAVQQLLVYRNGDSGSLNSNRNWQEPTSCEYELCMFILGKNEYDPRIFDEVEQPHAKVLPANDSKPIKESIE